MTFIEIIHSMIDDMMTDRDRKHFKLVMPGVGQPQGVCVKRVAFDEKNALTVHMTTSINGSGEPAGRMVKLMYDKDYEHNMNDMRTWTERGYMWHKTFDMRDPEAIAYIRRKVAQTLGIY